ncbi:MAG TPA: hypothetical protein VGL99_06165 [Chloroflexota bacterium]
MRFLVDLDLNVERLERQRLRDLRSLRFQRVPLRAEASQRSIERCQVRQGYYFARRLTVDDMERHLDQARDGSRVPTRQLVPAA